VRTGFAFKAGLFPLDFPWVDFVFFATFFTNNDHSRTPCLQYRQFASTSQYPVITLNPFLNKTMVERLQSASCTATSLGSTQ
jgi:hypothetical protein